jgi:hypothetical protein
MCLLLKLCMRIKTSSPIKLNRVCLTEDEHVHCERKNTNVRNFPNVSFVLWVIKTARNNRQIWCSDLSYSSWSSMLADLFYVLQILFSSPFFFRPRLNDVNNKSTFSWPSMPRNQATGRFLPRHRSSLNVRVVYKIKLKDHINMLSRDWEGKIMI